MSSIDSLLRCPACRGGIDAALVCASCGSTARRRGSILDFLAPGARAGAPGEVDRFYERRPFPGYAEGDDAVSLLDRARRSAFLRALDQAVPADARVLDCGCGTGQLAAFLALAGPRRTLVGADACGASLEAADAFRARAGAGNLHLLRADLFALPLAEGAFDVVVSRGVVHHTPDPGAAIASVARQVAPGGVLVLGFYETAARAAHRARRLLHRAAGRAAFALDPILRRRDLDPEKQRTWIEDQYRHPLERSLPLPSVRAAVTGCGLEWIRTVPPAPEGAGLFDPEPRPGALAILLRRAGWLARGLGDEDAGLVCLLARRQSRE